MYQSFEVSNFRCFSKLTVANLERVNLIAGVNNVGKTALLEALFLHCGGYNPALVLNVNAFRGIQAVKLELGQWVEAPWDSLFREFEAAKKVELVGENTESGRRVVRLKVLRQPEELAAISQFVQPYGLEKAEATPVSAEVSQSEVAKVLELEYEEAERTGKYYLLLDLKGARTVPMPPGPPFPASFQGARMRLPFREEAERFGKLQVQGKEDVLSEVLRLIEPRLSRLTMVVVAGEPVLHGDVGVKRLIPLPLMGEGMARLTSLVLAVGNAPNGVVLVDEIENGLHHAILPKVWQAIGAVARQFNTQIFATTHSLECIVAAHQAFSASEIYDFRLHRLERTQDTIRALAYDQEALEAAIETGLEVR